jgi:hypothetical protein
MDLKMYCSTCDFFLFMLKFHQHLVNFIFSNSNSHLNLEVTRLVAQLYIY